MKDVPSNRLLIQPTVQYRWLTQHNTIEFNVSSELIDQFLLLWTLFVTLSYPEPSTFFSDERVAAHDLVNNDPLFALLAGAIYAKQKSVVFDVWAQNSKLFWSISAT